MLFARVQPSAGIKMVLHYSDELLIINKIAKSRLCGTSGISKEVGRGPLHAMLFADDLVLCENTREEAEEQLELWRNAIENNGLRVSRSKTEYLPRCSCHDNVKLGGEEIKTVTTFTYLGSMFDAEVEPPLIAKTEFD